MLQGKTIVLGVTGGIAVFKAAGLCSKLSQAGANVRVIMTESASKFVTPLTFQALSRNHVMTDTFDEFDPGAIAHIDTADHADLFIIAPATANSIAKMAAGIADDMLSTTLLATTAPIIVAPAMNVHMYEHPAVQHNIELLRSRGVMFLDPAEGQLACGYVGKGRLPEPETIVQIIEQFMQEQTYKPLQGKKVLVTAGGTLERIDPVRYITNDSSGKMGYALAEEAHRMGAEVTLVTAPTALKFPSGVQVVEVQSTEDMLQAVVSRLEEMDIIFKAAAVADYRPAVQAAQKIKKSGDELVIKLVKNPDILQTIGERKTTQFIVGFAAETNDVDKYAMDKLIRKNCDLLVANDVTEAGAGFGVDTNVVRVFDRNGLVEALPMQSKSNVARRLLQLAAERIKGDN
ncbi:bifunctional phosphopantothenoylcysteine decarboxylase/phosphopantothenate--cysteine ligase CoaBC [Paenibacillus albiflavus]|uniref:Coenzyme A biosynthesis bifunctional protein CoaBC n=1 Tax=Paenibacillus albiflavus TaxID=2545760 RepID=A0A4V2WPI4_9BACL|nr:bifunctional phosphopantothenoylcysteine decarboxylase/phosphopantothenate--cysteine ligase CoaBC [Paenibacillus albiflavus]TCZ79502.1 bifunctional phosphopantothenoylcysteine decarboxylase/phosphopantothenate--cysteine ligase CoaBC [Paenibacillus albiflavus]